MVTVVRETERKYAAELKWLGRVLGDARDGEVLSGHPLAALEQTPQELVIPQARNAARTVTDRIVSGELELLPAEGIR